MLVTIGSTFLIRNILNHASYSFDLNERRLPSFCLNDATGEHMMQRESTTSLDSSVSVPLGVIDSDADSDLAFPRLDASEPEDVSRFLVKIHNVSGRTTLLEVSGFDMVASVKRRIAPNAISIGLHPTILIAERVVQT